MAPDPFVRKESVMPEAFTILFLIFCDFAFDSDDTLREWLFVDVGTDIRHQLSENQNTLEPHEPH